MAALLADLSVLVFIVTGFSAIVFLMRYPGEYGLWTKVVLTAPSGALGIAISRLFRRAEWKWRRWRLVRMAFSVESKAAVWVAGSLMYVGLLLALNILPDFGWLAFGISGLAGVTGFLYALSRWKIIRLRLPRITRPLPRIV